jgi:CheY-like chemotaxis protein
MNKPFGISVPKLLPACLVVEDSHALRENLSMWISFHGIQVVEAENGRDALNIIKEDLGRCWMGLVTDYQMPAMDGVQLIREMKALGVQVGRWILVSGVLVPDDSIQQLLKDYPDVVFLKKPYSVDQILNLLKVGSQA